MTILAINNIRHNISGIKRALLVIDAKTLKQKYDVDMMKQTLKTLEKQTTELEADLKDGS